MLPDQQRRLAFAVFWATLLFALVVYAGDIPDPTVTPGVVRGITVDQICSTRWGKDHRFVTAPMKAEVFRNYGLNGNEDPYCTPPAGASQRQRCEIDHLVPREIGGADDIANLWPQRYFGTWNAHEKDQLENRVHMLVCSGVLRLDEAQSLFLAPADWRDAYKRYFGGAPE